MVNTYFLEGLLREGREHRSVFFATYSGSKYRLYLNWRLKVKLQSARSIRKAFVTSFYWCQTYQHKKWYEKQYVIIFIGTVKYIKLYIVYDLVPILYRPYSNKMYSLMCYWLYTIMLKNIFMLQKIRNQLRQNYETPWVIYLSTKKKDDDRLLLHRMSVTYPDMNFGMCKLVLSPVLYFSHVAYCISSELTGIFGSGLINIFGSNKFEFPT